MSSPAELKALQVRATRIKAEIEGYDAEIKRLTSARGESKTELHRINQKIEEMTNKEPIVTEHALLRYIERVMGLDIEEIKARILTEANRKAIEFAGSCKIKSEGVELIVRNRQIVSIVGGEF